MNSNKLDGSPSTRQESHNDAATSDPERRQAPQGGILDLEQMVWDAPVRPDRPRALPGLPPLPLSDLESAAGQSPRKTSLRAPRSPGVDLGLWEEQPRTDCARRAPAPEVRTPHLNAEPPADKPPPLQAPQARQVLYHSPPRQRESVPLTQPGVAGPLCDEATTPQGKAGTPGSNMPRRPPAVNEPSARVRIPTIPEPLISNAWNACAPSLFLRWTGW